MKRAIASLFLALSIWPCLAQSATMAELEARLQTMEEELNFIKENDEQAHEAIGDIKQNMTVAGYSDASYIIDSRDNTRPTFHLHHLSLFFKQKLNKNWRFFSEIEFEDAPKFGDIDTITVLDCGPDGICGGGGSADDSAKTINTLNEAEGKIFTEAFNLDYTWRPYASFRVGRFFTPAGIWSIDHYPPFVSTQERPRHIRKIFPQTTDGAMVYGIIEISNHFVSYDAYISNGEGNSAHEDQNTHKAFGLRLGIDLPYLDNTNIGTTLYNDLLNDGSDKTAFGLHAKLLYNNYEIQTEYADALLNPASGSNYHMQGYYLQGQYHFSHWNLGLRYDYYTQDTSQASDEITNTLFTSYHITENLNVKLEHHIVELEDPAHQDYQKTIISINANLGN